MGFLEFFGEFLLLLKDAGQKAAFGKMHEGEFLDALKTFEKAGCRTMVKTFKVGHHVSWNSEAGRVRGKIIKVHGREVNYKGHVHHATPDEPQYEIKSDKTDHVALHKAAVLRRLG